MLSHDVRILNFDDSITRQKNLLQSLNPKIVDLKRLGPESRIWLNRKNAKEICGSFDPALKHCPTFVGSGDYHHISSLLIGQFEEPLTVIVFDHHPDWDILPPHLACASWTTYTLQRPNIKKLILIGVSSEDISTRFINTGNLKALKDDRLEIYPFKHRPTDVFFRTVPANGSLIVKGTSPWSTVQWRELFKENLLEAFMGIIRRVETPYVYISIDKDCLIAQEALTNWEEGSLNLKDLLGMLSLIKRYGDILGVDIVGDYSNPIFHDPVKKAYMFFDRHPQFTARHQPIQMIDAVNEKTNLEIIEALRG